MGVDSPWDTVSWRDITLHGLERNRIVISSSPLYINIDEEFRAVNRILDIPFNRMGWSRYIYIIVRGTVNLNQNTY